jgi:hypothetical protein
MPGVTIGDLRERLYKIKVDFEELVELLKELKQDNPIGGVDPGHCPPFACPPLVQPSGTGCDLRIPTMGDLPINVADAMRCGEAMAGWVGDMLTVVEGMNPNIVLPPRMGDRR